MVLRNLHSPKVKFRKGSDSIIPDSQASALSEEYLPVSATSHESGTHSPEVMNASKRRRLTPPPSKRVASSLELSAEPSIGSRSPSPELMLDSEEGAPAEKAVQEGDKAEKEVEKAVKEGDEAEKDVEKAEKNVERAEKDVEKKENNTANPPEEAAGARVRAPRRLR